MPDQLRSIAPWVRFAGCVLVVTVLYFGQAVIVPVALATLFTFVLTPVVTGLQRLIGRIPAVIAIVVLTFTVVGAAGYVLTRQVGGVVSELPHYQQNIRQKIRDIRWLQRGGSVETLQHTVEDLKSELEQEPRGTTAKPVVVQSEQTTGLWSFPTTLGAGFEWLANAGLVIVLVVFMLLERQDLRNRLIGLFGHGRLAMTTKAMDEAAWRVSRYLLVQSLINLSFGVGVAVGLTVIGLPYVLLWGSLAAVLRFIPYIGPWVGALSPVLVSLAVFGDWTRPLLVMSLFVGLELFTNLVVESIFYSGAAGVSQTALIVAVAFWTWLWGPLGLLMATPLTVCLVVLGKYVPGFEFVTLLMGDEPVFDPDVQFYQRLLAGDPSEASELIEQYVQKGSPDAVYDALMLPALSYAENDRFEGRLSAEEEHAVIAATRELLDDLAGSKSMQRPAPADTVQESEPIRLLGWPANGDADVLALRMLANALIGTPFVLEVLSHPILASEVVTLIRERRIRALCIADLPPSPPSKSRYVVKRVRAADTEVKIMVGRWAALGDETDAPALLSAGADRVDTRLVDTRDQLCRVFSVAPVATPRPSSAPATAPTAGTPASKGAAPSSTSG